MFFEVFYEIDQYRNWREETKFYKKVVDFLDCGKILVVTWDYCNRLGD